RRSRSPEDETAPQDDAARDDEAEAPEHDVVEERADDARDGDRKSDDGDEGSGRSRRRRRGRRGGRSRHREGATAPDGSVIAGSPADPTAEQPDIDPSFRPHGGWRDLPVRRRDEASLETPDHGVTSQGITWEIVGGAQEPEPEPEAEPATAAQEMPLPPTEPEPQPEPVAAAEPAPAEKAPAAREAAIGNGSLALAETAQKETAPQEPAEPEGPPRRGWWQRRFGGD